MVQACEKTAATIAGGQRLPEFAMSADSREPLAPGYWAFRLLLFPMPPTNPISVRTTTNDSFRFRYFVSSNWRFLTMIKKMLIVGSGAALLGLVFVGRDAMSYLRTSAGYVSDAVQETRADRVSGRSRAGHDPGPCARGPQEHARHRQGGGRGAAARRADRRDPLAACQGEGATACG